MKFLFRKMMTTVINPPYFISENPWIPELTTTKDLTKDKFWFLGDLEPLTFFWNKEYNYYGFANSYQNYYCVFKNKSGHIVVDSLNNYFIIVSKENKFFVKEINHLRINDPIEQIQKLEQLLIEIKKFFNPNINETGVNDRINLIKEILPFPIWEEIKDHICLREPYLSVGNYLALETL